MSAKHDRKFFDTFLLVLGILIVIAAGIYVLGRVVAGNTQERSVHADERVQAAITDRIAPVAKVAVQGQDNAALAEPAPKQPEALADMPPEEVFNKFCVACHGTGVAGAPKQGDKAAWAPRIAKGIDTLHKHALEGFQGQTGVMPPRGGAVAVSDKSIMDAVDHMVNASK